MESNQFTSHLRSKVLFFLVASCIAILPFQLKILAFESEWGRGFSNPYSSVFFTVFDGLLLLSGLWYLFTERKTWQPSKTLFGLLLFTSAAAASLLLSPFKSNLFHLLLLVKLAELPLFFLLLSHSLSKEKLLRVFVYSMAVQAAWGILQVLMQNDFGLQILGESQLSDSTAQLAKFSIHGWDLIRAYGSFPHPNVLGGFLALAFLLTWKYVDFSKKEKVFFLVLEALGLIASFSRSALLALLLSLLIMEGRHFMKNRKLALVLAFGGLIFIGLFAMRGFKLLSDPAVVERLQGYIYSWNLIKLHPLGLGFSHYTLFLDGVTEAPLMPWEYQPVHNIFVLLAVELGLPLFLLCIVGTSLVFSKANFKKEGLSLLCFILVIGLLDHYLLTLEQGRLLLMVTLLLLSFRTEAHSNKIQADPG